MGVTLLFYLFTFLPLKIFVSLRQRTKKTSLWERRKVEND